MLKWVVTCVRSPESPSVLRRESTLAAFRNMAGGMNERLLSMANMVRPSSLPTLVLVMRPGANATCIDP